jgi:hypothetical protein
VTFLLAPICIVDVASRDDSDGGDVFAILFANEEKTTFELSHVSVGRSLVIISPHLEGEWAGMRVLQSDDPCLPVALQWRPFFPTPMPSSVCIYI